MNIGKASKPLVRLTPIEPVRPVLGSAEGRVVFKQGWDAPLTDAEIEVIAQAREEGMVVVTRDAALRHTMCRQSGSVVVAKTRQLR